MDIQPQYVTLTDLLAKRLFRIPRYQRAYSWEKRQRIDMFKDIRALQGNQKESSHFMATVVGLRRDIKTIVTDQYRVIEVVDGQQRLTTLVILLKAIEKKLNQELSKEVKLSTELKELLVKQDNISLILLQTNHDKNEYFVDYLRSGECPEPEEAKTLADRKIVEAFHDCESFVDEWEDKVDLLRIIKNQLTFIFHEISDESVVYTVFEVLNNRGLAVSSLDRLKSILMSVAFEQGGNSAEEHIQELHNIWGTIYETIGLRQGLSSESLKFAATLKTSTKVSKLLGEDASVESLKASSPNTAKAIENSKWLLSVARSVDQFLPRIQPSSIRLVR